MHTTSDRLATAVAIPVEPARLPPTPELRLCLAVLEQALADLDLVRRRTVSRRTGGATAVVPWFRSSSVVSPFAFESICATLGLDAQAVRRAVGVTMEVC